MIKNLLQKLDQWQASRSGTAIPPRPMEPSNIPFMTQFLPMSDVKAERSFAKTWDMLNSSLFKNPEQRLLAGEHKVRDLEKVFCDQLDQQAFDEPRQDLVANAFKVLGPQRMPRWATHLETQALQSVAVNPDSTPSTPEVRPSHPRL